VRPGGHAVGELQAPLLKHADRVIPLRNLGLDLHSRRQEHGHVDLSDLPLQPAEVVLLQEKAALVRIGVDHLAAGDELELPQDRVRVALKL